MGLIPALLVSAAALAQGAPSPPPAVAAGIAAYDRGDFAAALAILKPIVYDVQADQPTPWSDPWATAYLAEMFRRGQGTEADWPLSCALFNNVWGYTRQRGGAEAGTIPFVEDSIKEVCVPQHQTEVQALRTSCYLDGVARREFLLESGSRIVADRLGFHVDAGNEHGDAPLGMGCHEELISLTEADVSIAGKSAGNRAQFLELFKWTNHIDPTNGSILRQLHWMIYETKGATVGAVNDQILVTRTGGAYPSADMPPGIRDAAVLQMNATGQVEWIVNQPGGTRGIIR